MDINKNNEIIEDLEKDISFLLEESNEISDNFRNVLLEDHPITLLLKGMLKLGTKKKSDKISYLRDKFDKAVNDFDIDAIIKKDEVESIEKSDDPNALSKEYERYKKELEDIESEYEDRLQSQKDGIDVSDDGLVASPTKKLPYSTIKVRFINHPNILSVTPGKGKKIETNLVDRMTFDILTIKESRLGYIFHLSSQKLPVGTTLLLYIKDLDSSPQENYAQLTYDKGRFMGDKKSTRFEIRSLS